MEICVDLALLVKVHGQNRQTKIYVGSSHITSGCSSPPSTQIPQFFWNASALNSLTPHLFYMTCPWLVRYCLPFQSLLFLSEPKSAQSFGWILRTVSKRPNSGGLRILTIKQEPMKRFLIRAMAALIVQRQIKRRSGALTVLQDGWVHSWVPLSAEEVLTSPALFFPFIRNEIF